MCLCRVVCVFVCVCVCVCTVRIASWCALVCVCAVVVLLFVLKRIFVKIALMYSNTVTKILPTTHNLM